MFPNGPDFPEPAMVQISAKRQNFFTSKEAAYENFKSKRLFSDWDDRALRAYVVSKKCCLFLILHLTSSLIL